MQAKYTIKTAEGWRLVEAKSPQAIREWGREHGIKILAILPGWKD